MVRPGLDVNVEVAFGAAGWEALIAPAPADDPVRVGWRQSKGAGVRAIDAPAVEIAPGITALHTIGTCLATTRAVSRPAARRCHSSVTPCITLQLNDNGISFLFDADAEHALRTREELCARFAGSDVDIGLNHLPRSGLPAHHCAGGRRVDRRVAQTTPRHARHQAHWPYRRGANPAKVGSEPR